MILYFFLTTLLLLDQQGQGDIKIEHFKYMGCEADFISFY